MNIKNILYICTIACFMTNTINASFDVVTGLLCGLIAGNLLTPNFVQHFQYIEPGRPRINVGARSTTDGNTYLTREGKFFSLDYYKTDNETPVVIEDNKGNFSVTTAGEFNGLTDVFLTACIGGYSIRDVDGKQDINTFIIQPLSEGRHFDINDMHICKDSIVRQAVSKFKKKRQNSTNK